MNALNTSATQTETKRKQAIDQKFGFGEPVVRKDKKPWFSMNPKKVHLEPGIVVDFAPDTGYQLRINGEHWWYPEEKLESAKSVPNPDFDLQAFVKGKKAVTRVGCTAKFVQFEYNNLTYQLKVEINCDGTLSQHDYARDGAYTVGIIGDGDMVKMLETLEESTKEIEVKEKEVVPENTDQKVIEDLQEHLKEKPMQEPTELEKQLVEAFIEDAKTTEVKLNAIRYVWFAKYLCTTQIDFVDAELKAAKTKEQFDAVIDKFMKSIKFK